jgi:uncharacterized radical SAM superfamily Fe-S cluster-containing enzyme
MPDAPPSRSGLVLRAEQLVCAAARAVWPVVESVSRHFPGASLQPAWAPAPLIRGTERSRPPLGWPRETDSLCPTCVQEVREEILAGRRDLDALRHHQGEIKARIQQRDGRIVMVKTCPRHGRFEELISHDPVFLERIERLFFGRDYLSPTPLREHGTSSIKYGRGAVLTVDLTNRCNMMCDACFMDANQVGYVHELDWNDIQQILDDSVQSTPKRQLSVQFSGGEPTLSPHFVEAIRYAREVGYFCVQCASNGIAFAQDPELCLRAKEAGLRLCYLQFDGVSNEAHEFRRVGNLFDVKRRAIDNLAAVGIDVVLVVTVVKGVNDDQVGQIVRFAIENADKCTVVSFQPVSFTGRDEEISDERRQAQRYTLSMLAEDVHRQLGITHPHRDWFPLSAMNPFSDAVDLILGSHAEFGALKCGCHPNCGIGTVLLVHKATGHTVPVCDFLEVEQLLFDVQRIADAGHGRTRSLAKLALAIAKNFRPEKAPPGYGLTELTRQYLSQMGATGKEIGDTEGDASGFAWRFLFVAGMHFQDLFNYDFRRTEMCVIPYGTQQGEISFCAYNTGVGWRNVVEKMHATATVADWYRKHGRHGVYAKKQHLPLSTATPDALVRNAAGARKRLKIVG